jgi:predicted dehydrogenase
MFEDGKLQIGIIGCGHWGPNHVRVFSELDRMTVTACCDLSDDRLARIAGRFPHVRTTTDYKTILADDKVDAVVIATPTNTHSRFVREALEAGKHVLVEKPLCETGAEGEALAILAKKTDRVLMVGHVFLFNAGIVRLRETINSGELGAIHYLDAVRTNLGPIRGDVNSLYDLATHDISIFNYLLDSPPVAVSCLGSCITQDAIEDVCFTTIQYADGTLAHVHVSWLNPRKVRTMTVVGSKKMAHWDDIDPVDTLRIFDKGLAKEPTYNSFGEFQCSLRSADMNVPAIPVVEPLKKQGQAFADWVLNGTPCGCGPDDGLVVVRTLEAAMESLANGGTMCPIESASPRLLQEADAPKDAVFRGRQSAMPKRKMSKNAGQSTKSTKS